MARPITTLKKVTTEEEKAKARESYIRKSNDLVQKTRYQLSLSENKILLYIISKISERDADLNTYTLSLKEFCEVCGIQSKGSYAEIKKIAKGLRDKSFWMKDEFGGEDVIGWLQGVNVNSQKGQISLTLDNKLKPFLLGMKKQFTKYKYLYVMAMRSSYSMRVYELMKSYQNMGGIVLTVEELREKLSPVEEVEKKNKNDAKEKKPAKLARWVDFKRFALEVALKEINELTDITVTYTPIKRGREVYELMFRVFKKNEKEMKISHERIHNKLGVYSDLAEYQRQMTLEEWETQMDDDLPWDDEGNPR